MPSIVASNPLLTGIIAGQLYDYATPYEWTMLMRQNFKFTSLLTSQCKSPLSSVLTFCFPKVQQQEISLYVFHSTDFNHGLDGNAPDCQKHVVDYFMTGEVGIVDGTVCGADFADQSLLTAAFGIDGRK